MNRDDERAGRDDWSGEAGDVEDVGLNPPRRRRNPAQLPRAAPETGIGRDAVGKAPSQRIAIAEKRHARRRDLDQLQRRIELRQFSEQRAQIDARA